MGLSNGNGFWGLVQGLWGGTTSTWSGDEGFSGGGGEIGFDLLLEGSSGGFVLMEDGVTFVELENGPGPSPLLAETGIPLLTEAGGEILT